MHEQIADLLEQLRRLQDLQVTIEVRFITLTDNFFERIGVDFDFNIDDNIDAALDRCRSVDDRRHDQRGRSALRARHRLADLTPTADLDLPFRQGSFALDDAAVRRLRPGDGGHVWLRDPERHRGVLPARKPPRATTARNILQAPKVTLFNGQTAFVSDTSQRPFVTSVIPVVGDFAAAQQPVIVVLNEGTSLSVQAVVSQRPAVRPPDAGAVLQPDRRRGGVHVHRLDDDDRQRHDAAKIRRRPDQQRDRTTTRHASKARRCSCRRSPSPR